MDSCCGSKSPPGTPPLRPAALPIRTETTRRLPLEPSAYRPPNVNTPERAYSNGNAIAGPSSSPRYSDPPRRSNGETQGWNRNQGFNMDDSISSPRRVPSLPRGARATRRDRNDSYSSAGQRSAGPYSSSTHENGNGSGNGFATQQQRGNPYREPTLNNGGGSGYYANAAVRAVAQNMAEGEGKLSVGIDFGYVTRSSLRIRRLDGVRRTVRPSQVSLMAQHDSSAVKFDKSSLGQVPTRRASFVYRRHTPADESFANRYRKVPTCILYAQSSPEEEAQVIAWGLEAKNANLGPGIVKSVLLPSLSRAELTR